jgi:negative regulator of sigma E activity
MSTEKIDLHYHQQLSALIDGELAPDQARFLLRRLQHDDELAGCVGRWQMLGDALRGNAIAPAPEGFAARVAVAVAAEAPVTGMPRKAGHGRRAIWGGGAIAASVAAVAFFIAVPQVPDEADVVQSPLVATQPAAPEPVFPGSATAPDAGTSAPATAAATASAPPRENLPRRSATRTRQAARSAAIAAQAPERAVANAPLPAIHSIAGAPPDTGVGGNPFADVRLDPPAARPWPRTVLPQYASGAFNAGYPVDRAALEFYPFEPRLPAASPDMPPGGVPGEDQ